MHGNVWEWCLDKVEDLTGYDKKENVVDPLSTSGRERVIRGGSWNDTGRLCRSAYRNAHGPAFRYFYLGFRICLAPIPAGKPMTESGTVAPEAEPGAGNRELAWVSRIGAWLNTRMGKKP